MGTRVVHSILLGIPLLFVTAAQVSAADDISVLPRESTERFLGQVRDFGDGRPSPNILYSTRGIGEAANSPGRATPQGSSVLSIGAPPANTRLRGSTLTGGTIERRPIAPYAIPGGTIEQNPVTPYTVNSPWR